MGLMVFINIIIVFTNFITAGYIRHIAEETTERLDEFAMLEQGLFRLIEEKEEEDPVEENPDPDNLETPGITLWGPHNVE